MLSFSLVAEALMGLIYHRPSGENFSFLARVYYWNHRSNRNSMDSFEITVKTAGLLIGRRAHRQSESSKLIDHGLFQLSRDSIQ